MRLLRVDASDFAYSIEMLLGFSPSFKGVRLAELCLKHCLLNFILEQVRAC